MPEVETFRYVIETQGSRDGAYYNLISTRAGMQKLAHGLTSALEKTDEELNSPMQAISERGEVFSIPRSKGPVQIGFVSVIEAKGREDDSSLSFSIAADLSPYPKPKDFTDRVFGIILIAVLSLIIGLAIVGLLAIWTSLNSLFSR